MNAERQPLRQTETPIARRRLTASAPGRAVSLGRRPASKPVGAEAFGGDVSKSYLDAYYMLSYDDGEDTSPETGRAIVAQNDRENRAEIRTALRAAFAGTSYPMGGGAAPLCHFERVSDADIAAQRGAGEDGR